MSSNIEEELIEKLSDFLVEKYEKKEIENKYTILTLIGKEGFGLVISTIDQNRTKWIKILYTFSNI